MSFQNKISVITPVFNRSDLLLEMVDSVIGQTYSNWELLLVDDGSDKVEIDKIRLISQKDDRIKYLERNRLPKGAVVCRNVALKEATGSYVIFLDSDDVMDVNCLNERIQVISINRELDFAVFNSWFFKESIDEYEQYWNVSTTENDLCRFLRMDGVWPINGPIYKMDFLRKNLFDESLFYFGDYFFALDLLLTKPQFEKYFNLKADCYIRKHNQDSLSQRGHFKSVSRTRFFLEKMNDRIKSHSDLFQREPEMLFNALQNIHRVCIQSIKQTIDSSLPLLAVKEVYSLGLKGFVWGTIVLVDLYIDIVLRIIRYRLSIPYWLIKKKLYGNRTILLGIKKQDIET